MDGHSSHYCPDLIKRAASEKILLFALPPHTTHITQPLDKGCFSPLKAYWQQACHDFYTNNPGRVITIYDFSVLFAKAWLSTMTASNILSAFKTTGICPFNRFAVQTIDNYYKSFKPETLIQQTGLTHIPLYSPGAHYTSPSSQINPNDSIYNQSPSRSYVSDDISDEEQEYICVLEPTSTSISKYLVTPKPPSKTPVRQIKSYGHVMTSLEISDAIETRDRDKVENKIKGRIRKLKG